MTHLEAQFDESSNSNDDDFWTHKDDKLLNSNFKIENSNTNISSKSRSKSKTTDNRVKSSNLSKDLDSMRAHTNDFTNTLDQMMKNLNLDAENHSENFSKNFSADNDQLD